MNLGQEFSTPLKTLAFKGKGSLLSHMQDGQRDRRRQRMSLSRQDRWRDTRSHQDRRRRARIQGDRR